MRSENSNRTIETDTENEDPDLPEGTAHVVVLEQPNRQAPEYRMPANRLQRYDTVDVEEYIDADEDPEEVTVLFEPGDELPLAVAADGTYSSFARMFACFDADGNRLDRTANGSNEAVRRWKSEM